MVSCFTHTGGADVLVYIQHINRDLRTTGLPDLGEPTADLDGHIRFLEGEGWGEFPFRIQPYQISVLISISPTLIEIRPRMNY